MATAAMTAPRGDVWIIGMISAAHGLSHFLQLVVPPLFPLLVVEFDVSYAALGLLVTVFYAVSGVSQTAAGFLVDRFGARTILLGGVALFGGAIAAMGLTPSFWGLVPLAALAGIGNSVFHPADFAVLNARVAKSRLGRAYGAHLIAGNIGWMLAPIASVGLAEIVGWRVALLVLGGVGLASAAWLASSRDLRGHAEQQEPGDEPAPPLGDSLRLLMALPILMCFAYFTLLSVSMVGLQTFSIPASMSLFGLSISAATAALSAYLVGGAAGILAGGVVADRTTQHHVVAVAGILLASASVAGIAGGAAPGWMLAPLLGAVGFFMGTSLPSRDMLVRQATPPGSSGRVYGFVYSGLDLGAALAPALIGWFLDRGEPRATYMIVLAALLLSIVTVLNMRRPAPARTAAPGE